MWQKIKNYYHFAQAFFSAVYFNFPSRKLIVIGVTGTDGKTTTVNMIAHILRESGKNVSMISSVNAQIDNKNFDTGFHVSTPSPFQVQKLLSKALEKRNEYFILEATSHGLDQNRLALVDFEIAAITNITHEHMDYHKSWDNYVAAKSKLFKNVKISILNKDDKSFDYFFKKVDGKIISYSQEKDADFNNSKFPIKLQIVGKYNLSNALAAAAVCTNLGIVKASILKSLNSFPGVIGRMQEVDIGQNFKVFIDFAHTPNGLKQALQALKNYFKKPSKLITVFGSAGQRDMLKRPSMGKVADKLADVIVLTSEDPRDEDPKKICEEISNGIKNKTRDKTLFVIPDRKAAIKFAIDHAKKGDLIATFGKGHEKSMTIKGKDFPWDEFNVVKEAIKSKIGSDPEIRK